jgi:hypothetical protein
VKVINCVLMDNVSVAEGSHIQNCVICSGAVIQERATLKDCQVGELYTHVASAGDRRESNICQATPQISCRCHEHDAGCIWGTFQATPLQGRREFHPPGWQEGREARLRC